ncbi:MAG: metallopeptidase family protein [Candidatus Limnocylindrales bacterium]
MPVRRRAALAHRHPGRRVPDRWADAPGSFERVVQEALEGLPAPFAGLLANVAVVVEDWPTPEQARDGGAPDGWLYGLYDGTPATEPWADHVVAPNVITLFRIPLQEDFRHSDELVSEIRRTVMHELAHHAGIDDDRLDELGYA